MRDAVLIGFSLLGALALTTITFVVGSRRDILPYIIAYFAFFGFGPVINYLTGGAIYHGTEVAQIPKASTGLFLALAGMALICLAIRVPSDPLPGIGLSEPRRHYHGGVAVLGILTTYALSVIIFRGPALLMGDKLSRIAAAGPLHATYLTVQLCAACLYFAVSSTPRGKQAFWINMAVYVTYCLLTQERDFIFVAFSFMLHVQLFRPKPMGGKLVVAGIASALSATALLNLRSGDGLGPEQVLNQGSVLFVDTFVMHIVPAGRDYLLGSSYVDALLSISPTKVFADPSSLTNWLAYTYAPGAPGGYGFSLTAEAYMNFGLFGIPVVFGCMALVQRLLLARIKNRQLGAYMSMLYAIIWMYTIRGESVVVVRMLTYGLILFALVHVTSTFANRRVFPDILASSAGRQALPNQPAGNPEGSAHPAPRVA